MGTRFVSRAIIVCFLVLVSTLFYYQVVRGAYYLNKARNNYIKIIPLPAVRGTFYDRHGEPLAQDRPVFNIAVLPYQIYGEQEKLFGELAAFTGVDERTLYVQYKRNFLNVFTPADVMVNLEKEQALGVKERFKENVVIRALPQRNYLFPYEFSHLLGYVKEERPQRQDIKEYGYSLLERVGKNGLEMYYDSYLKGDDGADLLEVDSRGEVVGYLGTKKKDKGRDIYLTVDARIQRAAYEAMGDRRGALICLDPRDGEILAFVSTPSFDSNSFIRGRGVGRFLTDPLKPLLNRGIQSRYSPGSVFKPVSALAALEEKVLTPETTFTCTGAYYSGRARFGCSHTHGVQDMVSAIAHSCNVYFYRTGLALTVDRLAKWARLFEMDKIARIDLPFERPGFVPDRNWKKKVKHSEWFAGDTLNFSIGQGYFEITPLRAALVMSVFANGGFIVYPYLAARVEDDPIPHLGKTRIDISSENLAVVRRGLREVVSREDGTAHSLEALGLEIAGKTGTAQTTGKNHGWFVGFFPYSQPKYAFCVFTENSGSSYESVKVCREFLRRLKEDNIL